MVEGGSSSINTGVLAETGDVFPFVLTGIALVTLFVVGFTLISRNRIALNSGNHSVSAINSNNIAKRGGMFFVALALVAGVSIPSTQALAADIDGDGVTGSITINVNSNRQITSVDFSVDNSSNTQISPTSWQTAGDVIENSGHPELFSFEESVVNSWIEIGSSNSFSIDLNSYDPIYGDEFPNGRLLNEDLFNKMIETGELDLSNVLSRVEYDYKAWTVGFHDNLEYPDFMPPMHTIERSGVCINGTLVDQALADFVNRNPLTEINEYWGKYIQYIPNFENLEFVGWNTAKDGTGDVVDAAYLASHPITADTVFYAQYRVKNTGNDTSSSDNPAQPGTSGDATDTSEVTDPDANAEADANKDNTEATDPAQNVEGTKEGDQAEQTV